ncbi:hypothetical protein PINS_up009951 [Pythium insidiosum]|nr:hypothetical protein PINS_up009951 [Pythium insidiosum]
MQLDTAAIWSLNLLPDPTMKSSSRLGGSVLDILNRGKTPMGRRLLERWIRQPLVDVDEIVRRQNLVQIFVDDPSLRMELLDMCTKSLPDLERLSIALERKTKATITDLVTVYDAAVGAMPRILELLAAYDGPNANLVKGKYVVNVEKVLEDLSGYVGLVEEVVDLDSGPNLVVNAKHDEELQTLRNEWNDLLSAIEDEHRSALQTMLHRPTLLLLDHRPTLLLPLDHRPMLLLLHHRPMLLLLHHRRLMLRLRRHYRSMQRRLHLS